MDNPEGMHNACLVIVLMLAGAPVNDSTHLLVFSCSWPCHEVNQIKHSKALAYFCPVHAMGVSVASLGVPWLCPGAHVA